MSELSPLLIPVDRRDEWFKGTPKEPQATVIVYGFDPIPDQLDPVVTYFSQRGDVHTFKYPNEVVTGGDPYMLPRLVKQLTKTVQEEIVSVHGNERVRMVGASLGSCIAMNIQDELGLTMAGVYATAGVNVAGNFMRNPVFRYARVPQKYEANGYYLDDVRAAWKDIDIYPDREKKDTTRFWANASILDPVVWYPLAKQNLRHFNGYTLHRSTAIWHTNAINEMANHIAEATERADSIKNR